MRMEWRKVLQRSTPDQAAHPEAGHYNKRKCCETAKRAIEQAARGDLSGGKANNDGAASLWNVGRAPLGDTPKTKNAALLFC